MNTCRLCGEEKTDAEMSMGRSHLRRVCRSCHYKASREWQKAHPERVALISKRGRDKLRAEMLEALGSVCACCGESRPQFLAVDHIHGGGVQHRKEAGSGPSLYRAIRNEGYPRDKYRLLCHNCNMAHGMYGSCPHDRQHKIPMMAALGG